MAAVSRRLTELPPRLCCADCGFDIESIRQASQTAQELVYVGHDHQQGDSLKRLDCSLAPVVQSALERFVSKPTARSWRRGVLC